MRKKILIIGGAGFIGHNLAIFLKKLDVTIVDGLNINNLEYLKKYNEFPNPSLTKILLNRLKLLKKSKIKFLKLMQETTSH